MPQGALGVLIDQVVGLAGPQVVALLHHRDPFRPTVPLLALQLRWMLDVGLEPGRLLAVQYDVREGDETTVADYRDPAEAHAILVLDRRTLRELVRTRRRHLGDRKT